MKICRRQEISNEIGESFKNYETLVTAFSFEGQQNSAFLHAEGKGKRPLRAGAPAKEKSITASTHNRHKTFKKAETRKTKGNSRCPILIIYHSSETLQCIDHF